MISSYNQLHVLLYRVTAYPSHLLNIKRGQISEKWVKRKHINSHNFNKQIPSQGFSANSSSDIMGMQFKGRYSSSMFFHIELKLFRISVPKFSETFRGSTADLTLFFDSDSANILLHIYKKRYIYTHTHTHICVSVCIFFPPIFNSLKHAKVLRNNKQ
jgi:hypothetical protein